MPANKANNKKTGSTPAAAAAEQVAGERVAGGSVAGAAEAGATGAGAAEAGATEAEAGAADEFVPANRAERRAQGKGKAANQPTGRGGAKVGGGHGPAQAQRMWTNRRSGG